MLPSQEFQGKGLTRYEYVKQFESPVVVPEGKYFFIRVDGQKFKNLADKDQWARPIDDRPYKLMNRVAAEVLRAFDGNIILSTGQSDEYSFLFRADCQLYNRRHDKILSTVTSAFSTFFTALYPLYINDDISPVDISLRQAGESVYTTTDTPVHPCAKPSFLMTTGYADHPIMTGLQWCRAYGEPYRRWCQCGYWSSCGGDHVGTQGVGDQRDSDKDYASNHSSLSIFPLYRTMTPSEIPLCHRQDQPLSMPSGITTALPLPPHIPIHTLPIFDARIITMPSITEVHDYIAWRQVDAHINNQYNAVFYALTNQKLSTRLCERLVGSTNGHGKVQLLRLLFDVEYAWLPVAHRKNSLLFWGNHLPPSITLSIGTGAVSQQQQQQQQPSHTAPSIDVPTDKQTSMHPQPHPHSHPSLVGSTWVWTDIMRSYCMFMKQLDISYISQFHWVLKEHFNVNVFARDESRSSSHPTSFLQPHSPLVSNSIIVLQRLVVKYITHHMLLACIMSFRQLIINPPFEALQSLLQNPHQWDTTDDITCNDITASMLPGNASLCSPWLKETLPSLLTLLFSRNVFRHWFDAEYFSARHFFTRVDNDDDKDIDSKLQQDDSCSKKDETRSPQHLLFTFPMKLIRYYIYQELTTPLHMEVSPSAASQEPGELSENHFPLYSSSYAAYVDALTKLDEFTSIHCPQSSLASLIQLTTTAQIRNISQRNGSLPLPSCPLERTTESLSSTLTAPVSPQRMSEHPQRQEQEEGDHERIQDGEMVLKQLLARLQCASQPWCHIMESLDLCNDGDINLDSNYSQDTNITHTTSIFTQKWLQETVMESVLSIVQPLVFAKDIIMGRTPLDETIGVMSTTSSTGTYTPRMDVADNHGNNRGSNHGSCSDSPQHESKDSLTHISLSCSPLVFILSQIQTYHTILDIVSTSNPSQQPIQGNVHPLPPPSGSYSCSSSSSHQSLHVPIAFHGDLIQRTFWDTHPWILPYLSPREMQRQHQKQSKKLKKQLYQAQEARIRQQLLAKGIPASQLGKIRSNPRHKDYYGGDVNPPDQ